MKNIRTILFSALALLSAGFVSCTEEEFQPGPEVSGEQVFFSETTPTDYSLDDNTTSVSIPVKRANTTGEYVVNVLADFSQNENEADVKGLFTVPESLTFADGEGEVSLVVSFNRADMEDGATYSLGLLLNDEENTTPYGYSQLSLTFTPWPWNLLGTGKYRDDWFVGMWQAGNVEVDVSIYENKSTKGLYMIENMYGWDFLTEFFGGTQEDILGAGYVKSYTPTNITIDCTDPAAVLIPLQPTGIEDGSSNNLGILYIESFEAGVLEDGVITFPTSQIFLGNAEYYGLMANANGLFRIVLPGYEARDYSLTASYAGMRVASDNETASAVIDFTYGADVAGITYLFASGDVTENADSYVSAIVAGTAENTSVLENLVESDGSATISAEVELQTGRYTVIAVPSDASGRLQGDDAAVSVFYFPGMTGGTVSECDINVAMYPVSEYEDAAEYVSQYPDYSSLVYEIRGSEISDLSIALLQTTTLNNALNLGFTIDDVMSAMGTDRSDVLDDLNSGTPVWDIFINLDAYTGYTLIASATNDYGKSKTISCELTTGEVPYSGNLVTGTYMMTCTIPEGASDGSDFVSENVFRISPTPDSQTAFVVSDLGFENGLSWNAEYDESAGTLTLDGTFPGQEDRGSFFGGWVTADNLSASALITYSDDSNPNVMDAPVVFKLNASGEIESLNTNIEVLLGLVDNGKVSTLGTVGVFYAGDTTVGSYQPSALPSSVASHSMTIASNFMFKGTVDTFFRYATTAKTAGAYQFQNTNNLSTVPAAGRKCDPLPKDPGKKYRVRTATEGPLSILK